MSTVFVKRWNICKAHSLLHLNNVAAFVRAVLSSTVSLLTSNQPGGVVREELEEVGCWLKRYTSKVNKGGIYIHSEKVQRKAMHGKQTQSTTALLSSFAFPRHAGRRWCNMINIYKVHVLVYKKAAAAKVI